MAFTADNSYRFCRRRRMVLHYETAGTENRNADGEYNREFRDKYKQIILDFVIKKVISFKQLFLPKRLK